MHHSMCQFKLTLYVCFISINLFILPHFSCKTTLLQKQTKIKTDSNFAHTHTVDIRSHYQFKTFTSSYFHVHLIFSRHCLFPLAVHAIFFLFVMLWSNFRWCFKLFIIAFMSATVSIYMYVIFLWFFDGLLIFQSWFFMVCFNFGDRVLCFQVCLTFFEILFIFEW